MRRMRGVFLLLALAAAARVRAIELAELLQAAIDNDAQTRALRMELENAIIADKRAALGDFSLKVGSGEVRVGRSDRPRTGDPARTLSASPQVALVLAAPFGTEVSVSLPTTYDLSDWSLYRSTPTVKITQPLNDLLGLRGTTTEDLERRAAIEQARVALAKRVLAVEKDVLDRLRALWEGESALGDLEVEIASARRDLDQALALGTYAAGSSALAKLRQTLAAAERKRELQQAKQVRALRELERIVGRGIDALPAVLPQPELELPEESAVAANPDVRVALLARSVEQKRFEENFGAKTPELTVSGAYARSVSERLGREYTSTEASMALGLAFDHLSVSAGPGIIEETGTLFFATELTWSPPGPRLDRLDRTKQENVVKAKEAALAAAKESYLQSRADLEATLADLEREAKDLADERTVAELALRETEAKHAQGLADDQELLEARWAVEKLTYEERLLAVDRLLARVQLASLVGEGNGGDRETGGQ